MGTYILRRIFQAIIVVFGVSIIIFALPRLTGDPMAVLTPETLPAEAREIIRVQFGLDKPLYEQYWIFISGAVRGDFGLSLRWRTPVIDVFLARFPRTLLLAAASVAWALVLGVSAGIFSAVKVGGWFDKFGKAFAMIGQSMPPFWLGLVLMLIFAVRLRWLPSSGTGTIRHLILPAATLGFFYTAAVTRLTRSAMLDVLDSDYIKLLRIKGMSESTVILKHALKNASLPILTFASVQFMILVNGTVIVEQIFNYPGVGRLVVDAIFSRDFPVIQACVLIASLLFVFTNLVVDIAYAYLDPRIRYQ